MDTDLLTQFLQYLLGMIPGDVAANIITVVTALVTICTLIIRFWQEPDQSSKWHNLWKLIHILASFKKIDDIKKGAKYGQKDH